MSQITKSRVKDETIANTSFQLDPQNVHVRILGEQQMMTC